MFSGKDREQGAIEQDPNGQMREAGERARDEHEKSRRQTSGGRGHSTGPQKEEVDFQGFPRGPVGTFGLNLALGPVMDKIRLLQDDLALKEGHQVLTWMPHTTSNSSKGPFPLKPNFNTLC